jgi:hypothetical protein
LPSTCRAQGAFSSGGSDAEATCVQ